ncbi:NAD(P)H-dependent oxidoreductase [Amycolatopsis sp. NPDC051373]|uniref:NAD(P)H-dependent oxidoreductase n=1 Tax=Amycolatopsis sp. NPDC051373 TaxID=3155801 RepID=UPI00344EDA7B
MQPNGFRPDECTATIAAAGFRRCVPRFRVFVMTCPFVRWCAPIICGASADVKLVFPEPAAGDHSAEIFAWPSEVMSALTERVAGSDLVVIASPTYKATYTGLVKAFLDRYAAGALAGVTAIPVMTGGSPAPRWASTATSRRC